MNKIKQIVIFALLIWVNSGFAVTVEVTANLNVYYPVSLGLALGTLALGTGI